MRKVSSYKSRQNGPQFSAQVPDFLLKIQAGTQSQEKVKERTQNSKADDAPAVVLANGVTMQEAAELLGTTPKPTEPLSELKPSKQRIVTAFGMPKKTKLVTTDKDEAPKPKKAKKNLLSFDE